MKITDWPDQERPREKLLRLGAHSLSDAELLAIYLRTGTLGLNALDLARQLLSQFGSLAALFQADEMAFCQLKGLGRAKYVQLQASLELTRRYLREQLAQRDTFQNCEQTKEFLASQLMHQQREVFAVLLLDAQHQLLHFECLFWGTVDSASVHPREIVKLALQHNAVAVILAHNHPSGVAEPSGADAHITQLVKNALKLVDVRVLDHIVVGKGETVSMAQRGLV